MVILQDAVFVHRVTFDLFTKTGKLFLKMSLIFFQRLTRRQRTGRNLNSR
jgi:hypothetical protein